VEDERRHDEPTPTAAGLIRIAGAATLWGCIPLLVRSVEASPLVVAFWRVAFATFAFLAYFLVTGRMRQFRKSGRATLMALVVLGVMLAATWVQFFAAMGLAPVAVVVLITFTAPLFIAAFSPAVTGDPFDRRIILPMGIALAGTILVAMPSGGNPEADMGGPDQVLGVALSFGAAVTIGIMTAIQKRLLRRTPPELIMFSQTTVASLVLLPAALLLEGPDGAGEWAALATLGLVMTTFPFLMFLSGLQSVRADRAAVVTYAEPVSAVILAALFLSEPVTLLTLLGGAAVVGGGVVAARLSTPVGPEAPIVVVAGEHPNGDPVD
jgi:drug/metabolite transporter (DMT)-like permease